MIFNSNLLKILMRVIFLTTFIIGMVHSYYRTDYIITPVMFGILTVVSIVELTFHLRKSERGWTQFLLSVKHLDFNMNYNYHSDSKQLHDAYQMIASNFVKLKTEKQAEHRLLQTVLSHIPIGLACCNVSGDVIFCNKAIKRMLVLEAFVHLHNIKNQNLKLYEAVSDEASQSGMLVDGSKDQRFLLKTEDFALQGEDFKLISLTDIKSTLDTHELVSYQKLMRVMTHEIMNSATPILSLIQVINMKLINGEVLNTLEEKDQKNTAISLKAVETRTNGMLKFVEAYRQINKDFNPIYETTYSKSLIDHVVVLSSSENQIPININDTVNQDLVLDRNLITQVMINLIKNSMEVLSGMDNPSIRITLENEDKNLLIQIDDNGPGVLSENASNVFVPFYTTKKEGTGIGLAISRKIIKAHGGTISYHRLESGITRFEIFLPEAVSK